MYAKMLVDTKPSARDGACGRERMTVSIGGEMGEVSPEAEAEIDAWEGLREKPRPRQSESRSPSGRNGADWHGGLGEVVLSGLQRAAIIRVGS